MSLLLEHGHGSAMEYPIGLVWDEAQLVVDRVNGMEATRATLINQAVGALLSKDGSKGFQKLIKKLVADG